jgi:chromosome segregation ATPase
MPDATILALVACAALLLAALVAARGARAECGRLREEGRAHLRDLSEARRQAEVAVAQGHGHAGLLAAREERLAEVAAELSAWRASHDEARGACAEAEARCAAASETVAQLKEIERRLREDVDRHGALLREEQKLHAQLRADHAALRTERDQRLASATREIEALRSLREEMTREFRALAHQTLQATAPSSRPPTTRS